MPIRNEAKKSMLITNYQNVDDIIEEFYVVGENDNLSEDEENSNYDDHGEEENIY